MKKKIAHNIGIAAMLCNQFKINNLKLIFLNEPETHSGQHQFRHPQINPYDQRRNKSQDT
jgi:hypothetical protein